MSLSVDQLAKPLKIKERIQETAESVSLVLEIPADLKTRYHYQAGQFVTFFLTIGGEQIARSYSLASSPLTDSDFKITVKKVPGGRGSNFLCDQVKAGDTLMTTPPAGNFFKPSLEPKGMHYFLFAAGSGITPVYSIMKTVLTASPLNHVTLVYGNRNEGAIIYQKEIEQWAQKHPAQLDVIHVLSKPSFEWPGRRGRIDRTFLTELLDMPHSGPGNREYYLCGPVEFMHVVRNSLLEYGIKKELVKEENFGVATHKPGPVVKDNWTFIGPATEVEAPEKIIAEINGEIFEVAATAGKSVLESLIENGAQPPYSCMDGACMACLAKVQEGRVYQEDPGILSDDNVANCESLTCQAKPLSRIVKITYDNI
ncbi:MAG: 2Fe-2S iron-sulfur cluster-binding protein [Bdellovibrionales bacterium]